MAVQVRIIHEVLSSLETRTDLMKLHDLCSGLLTTSGRQKILQSGRFGAAFTTSSVSRVLGWVRQGDPVCDMIVKGVRQLRPASGDGDIAALTVVLITQLVIKFSELQLPPCVRSNALLQLGSILLGYMKSSACECRVPLDVDSTDMLMQVIHSGLTGSVLYDLQYFDRVTLQRHILKAYLLCSGSPAGDSQYSAVADTPHQYLHILTMNDSMPGPGVSTAKPRRGTGLGAAPVVSGTSGSVRNTANGLAMSNAGWRAGNPHAMPSGHSATREWHGPAATDTSRGGSDEPAFGSCGACSYQGRQSPVNGQCLPTQGHSGCSDSNNYTQFTSSVMSLSTSNASSMVYSGLLLSSGTTIPHHCLHPERVKSLQNWFRSRARIVSSTHPTFTVITVSASLAADAQDFPKGLDLEVFEHAGGPRSLAESGMVHYLMQWAKEVTKLGVNVVLCQRCVHPLVRQYFLDQAVLVLDRLGADSFRRACCLTAGEDVCSIEHAARASSLGKLSAVDCLSLHNNGYWHLSALASDSPVATLVLTAPSENGLEDLKDRCWNICRTLDVCLTHPHVSHGGGCADWHLLRHMLSTPKKLSVDVLGELACTQSQFAMCWKTFAQCLYHLVSVRRTSGDSCLAHRPDDRNHMFTIDQDDDVNSDCLVACNCGKVSQAISSLHLVHCVSDAMVDGSNGSNIQRPAGGDSAQTTMTQGPAGSGLESEHSSQTSATSHQATSAPGPASAGSQSVLWDCLATKTSMLEASIEIAAAAVRIGMVVQEL